MCCLHRSRLQCTSSDSLLYELQIGLLAVAQMLLIVFDVIAVGPDAPVPSLCYPAGHPY